MTRGQLPQRTGLLGLNGGGTAAAVPSRPLPDPVRLKAGDQLYNSILSSDSTA